MSVQNPLTQIIFLLQNRDNMGAQQSETRIVSSLRMKQRGNPSGLAVKHEAGIFTQERLICCSLLLHRERNLDA